MEKSGKNSYMIKALVFVSALVILTMSTTYAYFTLKITGTSAASSLTAAKLSLATDLTTKAAFSNTKFSLINASDKATKANSVSFYITNNSTAGVSALYTVYLTNVTITKNLKSADLKWELVKSGTTESTIASGDFSGVTGTATTVTVNVNGTNTSKEALSISRITLNSTAVKLAKGSTDNLIFRIWLQNSNANQTSLLEGSFKGKLAFEATPTKS